MLVVYTGTVLGANWQDIRHALQPFDTLIAVAAILAIVLFVWWRMGMPGRPGRRGDDAAA
jgi:membrane protein DedA with SNARE-associated domain